MVCHEIEDQVVALRALSEIFLGVIDDAIRADGSDHLHIPRTAHAGDLCAERPGDLHSESTHASRRSVDQDLLPRSNLSLVAKTLQCGQCRHRHRSCLLKRYLIRLHSQFRLRSTRIFGKGAFARAEYLVARLELCYVPANRFNLAGNIHADSWVLWFAQPGH